MFQQLFSRIDNSIIVPRLVTKYNKNSQSYLKTLKLFIGNHLHSDENLENLIYQDPRQAYTIAHTLKGVSKLIGSESYFQTCDHLLKQLKLNVGSDYQNELSEFKRQHQQVCDAVQRILAYAQTLQDEKESSKARPSISNNELSLMLKELVKFIENYDTKAITYAEKILQYQHESDVINNVLDEILDLLENYRFEPAKLKAELLILKTAVEH